MMGKSIRLVSGRGLPFQCWLRASASGNVTATAEQLARDVTAGDVVLVMGGGHSYQIGEQLLERLGHDHP